MMGKTKKQINFSDYWIENKIKKNSYWYKLRQWALNYLDENIFQDLFSYYGRESVSPVYTFMAILIQLEKGYSDREFEEASIFDDRIKYALTAPRDFDGIDAVTLCDHRSRFFKSEIGRKIFLSVLEKAKEAGMFDKNNLHIVDSFMVWGQAAKQDTYTMIFQCIKMTLKICGFHELKTEAEKNLIRKDYDIDRKKPIIKWEDKKEKAILIDELVRDAYTLIDFVKNKVDKKYEDLIDIVELLEKVSNQDVYLDKDGRYKITEGVAKDRTISINDPEMRHGHKTTSKIQDGYKTEILTGGEKGELVIGLETVPANVVDGTKLSDLLDKAKEDGYNIDKIYGDSAYSGFEEIEKRKGETEFVVKFPNPSNKKGKYTKDDFNINLEEGKVTCPNNATVEFDKEKEIGEKGLTIDFKKACENCPLKDKCTDSKKGRKITINKNEKKYKEARKKQNTEEYKKDYAKRSNVERNIYQVTSHGGRQSRYVGIKKTAWQVIMACINNNIKKFMSYIYKNDDKKAKGGVCPNVS